VFWASNSIELPPIVVDPIGPVFWPRLLAITAILLAIIYAAGVGLRVTRNGIPDAPAPSEEEDKPINYRYLAGTLVLIGVYLAGLEVVGYYLSTPIFVLCLLLLLGVRSWIGLLAPTIGLVLAWGLLFQIGLGVPLPKGLIF
jgi:hypothetical protein